MRDEAKAFRRTAAILLGCVLLVFPAGESIDAGYARNDQTSPGALAEAVSVDGMISFELAEGESWRGMSQVPSMDETLAGCFQTIGVVEVEPYFQGIPLAERSPEGDRLRRIYKARYTGPQDPDEVAAMLMSSPCVSAASSIPVRAVTGLPNDPRFGEQWGFRQVSGFDMDLPEAWDVFHGDSSVVIAVLDTGLDRLHPDLGGTSPDERGNVWVNSAEAGGEAGVDDDKNGYIDDIWGWDFVHYDYGPEDAPPWPGEDYLDPDPDPADFHGHGTAVAGVAGAVGDNGEGVAGFLWNCHIMGLRCGVALNTGGATPFGAVRMDWCAEAVLYAADMGASVINASWESGYDVGLEAAVDYAVARGVVVSVAAGNRNGDPVDLTQYNYLSSRGDCLDVAAVEADGTRWGNSNYGEWVDVAAPGAGILTLKYMYTGFRGYALWSGTSFAAPAASAAAAWVRGNHPQWSAAQVIAHLQSTGRPLKPPDPTVGAGLINAFNAVRQEDGGWSVELGSAASTQIIPLKAGDAAVAIAAGLENGTGGVWDLAGTALESWPVDLGGSAIAGIASGDCVGDGRDEVVFVDREGHVAIVGMDGSMVAQWDAGAAPVGEPVLASLEAGGGLEVVLCTEDRGVHAWDVSGDALAGWPVWLDAAPVGSPAAADMDGVPGEEVVVACGNGFVHCISPSGDAPAGWPVDTGAPLAVAPSIADVSGDDGLPEVVIGTVSGLLHAFDSRGDNVAGWPFGIGAYQFSAGVSLGDLDRDGFMEALWPGLSSKLLLYDTRGFPEPGWPLSVACSGGPALMADVTGDSIAEVVAAVEGVGIGAWRADGSMAENWPKPTDGAALGPVAVGDYDGDGRPEVFAGSADGKLHCWDLGGVAYVDLAMLWPLPGGTRGNNRTTPPASPGDTTKALAPVFRIASLTASPNPANSEVTIVTLIAGPNDEPKRASVRIFDAMGRLVNDVAVGYRARGTHRDRWDGSTESGERPSSGVYFCVATVENSSAGVPIILVR